MKTSSFSLCFFLLLLIKTSYSQQISLFTADQNLRYKESQDKYIKLSDSLNRWHSVTLQETYKAYDWYEAQQARKQQRREWRHLERMSNNRYRFNNYYTSGFDRYNNYYRNPWQNLYRRYNWW